MSMVTQALDIPVEGGSLRVLRFGSGPNLAVGIHGGAGSGMVWRSVARQLPEGWTLLAPDLRGRGHSAGLPGPYGIRRHAADVIRVLEHVGAKWAAFAGHSLGAYVAVLATELRPDLVRRLIMVDGGLSLPVPDGTDLDQMLAAVLGPVLVRLQQTFATPQDYVESWREHPALTTAWNPDIEAYVRYDLTGPAGAVRSRVVEAALRDDGRDLLVSGLTLEKALHALVPPTLLLTAPNGMTGQPPGLVREPLLTHWLGQLPHLRAEQVPDTNHYTILLGPGGAATVARRLAAQASWPADEP